MFICNSFLIISKLKIRGVSENHYKIGKKGEKMYWIIPFILIFLIGCSGYQPTKNFAYDQKGESKINPKILDQNSTKERIEKYQPEKDNKEEKGE
jgi:hypothetical protein